jgi:pimeloyl-ACP methyl ester carboxylesterase
VEDRDLASALLDGVRIRYCESGCGEPPIVFVHGWACDHRFFAPQLAHFAARHRVVALDQRGFGASDKPDQHYTIEGFADDLARLCGELDVEHPVIVGHSMGGAVALATAARYPDFPAAIVLCDPAIFFAELTAPVYESVFAALGSDAWQEAAREFVEGFMFIETDDPERKAWIVEQMCATPQHVLLSALRHIYHFDAESAARACRVPVLNIDAEQAFTDAGRLRGACAQLETARIPGVGHFHQLEAPNEVNVLVERFVAAHTTQT